MPDLFVIDHGHNDWKYRDANGNIDIELEPTVENIKNGLHHNSHLNKHYMLHFHLQND